MVTLWSAYGHLIPKCARDKDTAPKTMMSEMSNYSHEY